MKTRMRDGGLLLVASLFLVVYAAVGGCSGDSETPSGGNGDGGGTSDGGGSPDAGMPADAGTDAGADTGHDASTVVDGGDDTGTVLDAGGTDTGEPDAGHPDSGTDAGKPDAGSGCAPNCPTGEMVTVSAGSFQMGCNSAVDTQCQSDEKPYHSVNVPGFKIDKYEVTTGEYQSCVDPGGGCTAANTGGSCNYGVSGRGSHPINCENWNQATEYCVWAGKRLPTEAEWEKAARGTDGRKYPWGNDSLDCDHAVHSANGCSNSSTASVGSKPAGVSPYGAEDMVGNVWEWVEDWYHDTYTGAPTDGSAWVTPTGSYRVMRGGSWFAFDTVDLRASSRLNYPQPNWNPNIGFRCAQ